MGGSIVWNWCAPAFLPCLAAKRTGYFCMDYCTMDYCMMAGRAPVYEGTIDGRPTTIAQLWFTDAANRRYRKRYITSFGLCQDCLRSRWPFCLTYRMLVRPIFQIHVYFIEAVQCADSLIKSYD